MVSIARSLSQFRNHPLRTFLTLLGMVFGVGSVVAMVSIGEGAQQEILQAIEAMGATNTHITSRPVSEEELSDTVNDSQGLSRQDVPALLELVPGVQGLAYRTRVKIGVTDLKVATSRMDVFAVSDTFMTLHNLKVKSGRGLRRADFEDQHRVVVIGDKLAGEVFGQKDPVGERIRLDFSYFEIVGVLDESTTKSSGGDSANDPQANANAILVPFETAVEELKPSKVYGELDLISLQVGSTEETLVAKAAATPILRASHGGVEDFEVIAPEEILQQRKAAQSVLNIVLVSIAAISLIVGGIGVMNIMLANIMERIHEIGLRRAVGARRRDIRNQFLLEAILICFVGGVIGIVIGNAISFAVARFVDLPVAFAWESMLIAFGISVAVGVIFGIVPAIRAANINPIEALQRD